MWASSQLQEAERAQAARDKAEGKGPRISLSPAALKRKLAAKKAAQKAKP